MAHGNRSLVGLNTEPQNLGRRSTKDYHSNIVNGGSAHFGDKYQFNCGPSPQEQMLDRFLDSLRDPDMFLRENQITDSFPTTFDWVFHELPQQKSNLATGIIGLSTYSQRGWYSFESWLKDSNSPYWIYGKPGSGKSTLMKYLARHQKTTSLLEMNSQGMKATILKFYFWMPGSEIQRSMKGCLSSLLFQASNAQPDILMQHLSSERNLQQKKFIGDWSVAELKSLLSSVLQNLKPCCIFLDGVDEYDKEGDVNEILTWIEDLTEQETKVCLSSRPEPEITESLSCLPRLRLQDLTRNDIQVLVEGRLKQGLKLSRFADSDQLKLDRLVEQIVDKANGVFLWACLAIRGLIHGLKNGDSIVLLEKRLDLLPSKLEELYSTMWHRVQQEDRQLYRDEAYVFLTLFRGLTQFRPISLLLFTLAVEQRFARRIIQAKKCDKSLVDDVIKSCSLTEKKLWSRTGGLIECIRDSSDDLDNIGSDSTLYDEFQFLRFKKDAAHNYFIKTGAVHSVTSSIQSAKSDDTVCNCYQGKCPLEASRSTSIKYIHASRIDFIHRSAAEFVRTLDSGTGLDVSGEPTIHVTQRFATSLAALRSIGCGVHQLVPLQPIGIDKINGADAEMCYVEIASIISEQLRQGYSSQICKYGWYHSFYMQLRTDEIMCPDFLGQIAQSGRFDLLQKFLLQIQRTRLSPYYLGYLVFCVAGILQVDLESYPDGKLREERSRLCSLLIWLLKQDVSLHVPHAMCLARPAEIIVRTPYEECWQMIVRASIEEEVRGSPHVFGALISKVADALTEHNDQVPKSVVIFINNFANVDVTMRHKVSTIIAEAKIADLESLGRSRCDLWADRKELLERFKIIYIGDTQFGLNASPQASRKYERALNGSLMTNFDSSFGPSPTDTSLRDELYVPEVKLQTVLEERGLGFVIPWMRRAGNPDEAKTSPPFACEFNAALSPRLVAPDMTKEVSLDDWYEHSELRDWHERRRRGLIEVPKNVEDFEDKHKLTPSYRRQGQIANQATAPSRKRKRQASMASNPEGAG